MRVPHWLIGVSAAGIAATNIALTSVNVAQHNYCSTLSADTAASTPDTQNALFVVLMVISVLMLLVTLPMLWRMRHAAWDAPASWMFSWIMLLASAPLIGASILSWQKGTDCDDKTSAAASRTLTTLGVVGLGLATFAVCSGFYLVVARNGDGLQSHMSAILRAMRSDVQKERLQQLTTPAVTQ